VAVSDEARALDAGAGKNEPSGSDR
jgi:hypothetical protein